MNEDAKRVGCTRGGKWTKCALCMDKPCQASVVALPADLGSAMTVTSGLLMDSYRCGLLLPGEALKVGMN